MVEKIEGFEDSGHAPRVCPKVENGMSRDLPRDFNVKGDFLWSRSFVILLVLHLKSWIEGEIFKDEDETMSPTA